jgi:hypothetical protein
LIAALQAGDKSTELALEKANEAIIDRFRGLLMTRLRLINSIWKLVSMKLRLLPEMFDLNQLSFLTIANLPKSERGSGIPKEAWAEFVADYKETMQKARSGCDAS